MKKETKKLNQYINGNTQVEGGTDKYANNQTAQWQTNK